MGVPDVDGQTPPVRKRQRLSLKAVRQKTSTLVLNDNNNASKSSSTTSSDKGGHVSAESSSTEVTTSSESSTSTLTDSTTSQSSTDTRVPAVASLENFGNTCFMNSVMQVLRYTPGFLENLAFLFQDIQASEKMKRKNKVNKDDLSFEEENSKKCWKVVKNVYKVYRDLSLLEEKYEEVASDDVMSMAVKPYKILQSIRDLNPMFEGYLQHDAQEFLRCFLCYLQDAEKEVQKFYSHLPHKLSPKLMLNPIMQRFLQTAKIKNEQNMKSVCEVKNEENITSADDAVECEKVKINLFTKPQHKTEAVKSPTKEVNAPKLGDTASIVDTIAVGAPSGAKTESNAFLNTDLPEEFTIPVENDVTSANNPSLKTSTSVKSQAKRGRRFKPYNAGLSRDSVSVSEKCETLPEKDKGSKRGRKSKASVDKTQPSVSDMFGKTYSNKKRLGMRGAVLKKTSEDLFDEMQALSKQVGEDDAAKIATSDKEIKGENADDSKDTCVKPNNNIEKEKKKNFDAKTEGVKMKDKSDVKTAKASKSNELLSVNKTDTASVKMETDELDHVTISNKQDSKNADTVELPDKLKSDFDNGIESESSMERQSFQDMFSKFLMTISAEEDSDSVEMLSDSDSEDIVRQKIIAKKLHITPRKSPRKVSSEIFRASPKRIGMSNLSLKSKSASAVEMIKSNQTFTDEPSMSQSHATKLKKGTINSSQNAMMLSEQTSSSSSEFLQGATNSPTKKETECCIKSENNTDVDTCILPRTPVAMDPVVKLENCDYVFGDKGTSVSASYATKCLTPIKRSPRKSSRNYLKQRSFLEILDIENEEEREKAIFEMFNSPVKSRSKYDLTERLFQGTMMLRTRCLQCESSRERQEDFHDISVPVRLEKVDSDDEDEEDKQEYKCRLLDLIEASTEVEKLLEDNKYFCDECKAYVEAERSLHYDVMPDVLTLHLKRFSAGSGRLGYISKINDPVEVPLTLPCLRYKCPESCLRPDHRYKLYAIVTHSGATLSSGHYLSYVRALPKHKNSTSHPFQSIVDNLCNSQTDDAMAIGLQTEIKTDKKQPGCVSDKGQPESKSEKKQPLTRKKAGVTAKLPSRFNDKIVSNTKVKAFANVAPKKGIANIAETVKTSTRFSAEWFECDDETVRVFETSDFADLLSGDDGSLLGTPYLLFYHKATLC